MMPYKNIKGNSGVVAYEIGKDFIKVQFLDNSVYLYNYQTPGKTHVETMKQLALKGKDLSTYISQNIRKTYAAKLH